MEQADSREGHQVDTVIEAKVIAADPSEGELEEITSRGDLHQRSDREISIEKVVSTECQIEYRVIDRSGCESQTASEPPPVVIGVGPGCEYGGASDQDS